MAMDGVRKRVEKKYHTMVIKFDCGEFSEPYVTCSDPLVHNRNVDIINLRRLQTQRNEGIVSRKTYMDVNKNSDSINNETSILNTEYNNSAVRCVNMQNAEIIPKRKYVKKIDNFETERKFLNDNNGQVVMKRKYIKKNNIFENTESNRTTLNNDGYKFNSNLSTNLQEELYNLQNSPFPRKKRKYTRNIDNYNQNQYVEQNKENTNYTFKSTYNQEWSEIVGNQNSFKNKLNADIPRQKRKYVRKNENDNAKKYKIIDNDEFECLFASVMKVQESTSENITEREVENQYETIEQFDEKDLVFQENSSDSNNKYEEYEPSDEMVCSDNLNSNHSNERFSNETEIPEDTREFINANCYLSPKNDSENKFVEVVDEHNFETLEK